MKKLKELLGIRSSSKEFIVIPTIHDVVAPTPEEVVEAIEQARKREIWERQNLPLGR